MSQESEYNRVILVTGSNTGIGFQLVRLLAAKGHTVYLAARRADAGKEAQQKLKTEHGLEVKFVHLDLHDIKSIETAKDTIEKEEGRLDVLVNNAATLGTVDDLDEPQSASTIDLTILRTVFETNFFGLVQTTHLPSSPNPGMATSSKLPLVEDQRPTKLQIKVKIPSMLRIVLANPRLICIRLRWRRS
ncbi:hypothetical protein VNI00_017691 [Paramarasmius palmivorus]|uniref:NAD(P)-binding protein n=1 Tax=Paramarasmius palmivorus TaxID=297713 RepID=A0AAW0B3R0_9AGAR